MTTKTINTNKYGKVDIRKTSEKLNVVIGDRAYERVAWEDTAACYWVLVKRCWYRVDNMAIAHQRRFHYNSVLPDLGVYGI